MRAFLKGEMRLCENNEGLCWARALIIMASLTRAPTASVRAASRPAALPKALAVKPVAMVRVRVRLASENLVQRVHGYMRASSRHCDGTLCRTLWATRCNRCQLQAHRTCGRQRLLP
jgi:hypothetical protein